MGKQSITVELDDETIRYLTMLGKPIEVIAHLAFSAAEGARRPSHPKREQTDASLRVEREKSDVAIAKERADVEQPLADIAIGEERADRRRYAADLLTEERDSTDQDLIGERAHVDTLILDQREANEKMVRATIWAGELAVEADAARDRAVESERELHAVAEFREMFIGMLGHDLRNPLGSIIMAAAFLLRRGHLQEQDAEMATRIIRSSQRMSRMIAQMLDLTRARLGGGLSIERKPTDLREVCRDVIEEFETAIQLECEGDVTGTWDEDRLAEVISNLAGNAIEYAAPGTVVIIKAHADGAEVVVEVSNRGEPIPADVLPFIFEAFRRAKKHEKSATGNLGLGLYISHQIVLSHGGTLDARSADGTTTFVMRLPRGAA